MQSDSYECWNFHVLFFSPWDFCDLHPGSGICHQDIRILFSAQILTLDFLSKSHIEEVSFNDLFGNNIIFSFCWKIIKAFSKDVWLLQTFEAESREFDLDFDNDDDD